MKEIYRLLVIMNLCLLAVTSNAEVGDTFDALTEEGVRVTYMITGENEVQVGTFVQRPEYDNEWTFYDWLAIHPKTRGFVTIPEYVEGYHVTAIGGYAFCYCEGLLKVFLPESIKRIGCWAFLNDSQMVTMKIPSNVEAIEDGAFYNCTSLKVIDLPESIKTIGNAAFKDCI